MLVYFCLSIYILTVLFAGVLMITGRKKYKRAIVLLITVHVLAGIAALVYVLLPDADRRAIPFLNYSFLLFLCTGLLAGGLFMRSAGKRIFKVYFSFLFLSLAFFIYSPSRFITLLIPGETGSMPKRFHITQNYFLEPQRSLVRFTGKKESYKLVQEFGLFHKTIRRDIQFEGLMDSVRFLGSQAQTVSLRLYHHPDSAGSWPPDSTDLNLSLIPENNTEIIRKSP